MLSDAYAQAIAEVCRLIRLMVEDQPPELRRESWARWFQFWEPFWKPEYMTEAARLQLGLL